MFSAGVGAIHEVATTCDNKLKQSEESLLNGFVFELLGS